MDVQRCARRAVPDRALGDLPYKAGDTVERSKHQRMFDHLESVALVELAEQQRVEVVEPMIEPRDRRIMDDEPASSQHGDDIRESLWRIEDMFDRSNVEYRGRRGIEFRGQ